MTVRERGARGWGIARGDRGILAPLVLAAACGGATVNPGDGEGIGGGAGTKWMGESGSSAGGRGPSAGGTAAGAGAGGRPSGEGSGATAGAAGTATLGGTSAGGDATTGGTAGSGGSAGTGGTAGTGGSGGSAGTAGQGPSEFYRPRTGAFKMLVYSLTTGSYRHVSIDAGQEMLKAIGEKQGFEVTVAADATELNPVGLAQYEIVFFMNSAGDKFTPEQRTSYEEWMTKGGAYAGMHSAAHTGSSWEFFKEVTAPGGLHDYCCALADMVWTPEGASHVTARGLPSPWSRPEEWILFDQGPTWSSKPGVKVLSTVTTMSGGTRLVSAIREWGNFRSFYTSLGHESTTYADAGVIKHVTAGVMWAVRREALIK
jgi:hypothetical protein